MGYDYKSGSSNPVGSVAPIGGPTYDIGDTIAAYVVARPGLEGHPRRAVLRPRLVDGHLGLRTRRNISGTKNGASTTVVYGTARQYAADHGRQCDPVEGVAWTVYTRQNCTATYGCVTPWREIYYDDATALGLKYDLDQPLQPARRRHLGARLRRHPARAVRLLKAKFITDTVPPVITRGRRSARRSSRPTATGGWTR